ncbi:hypothetical protein KY325_00220 [Candidatus Woesearchaeota archaeon]|nr:hypothetical protein [Candidatus Woesearchaeota archaeon]
MDEFRFSEEEESRLVVLAGEINEPLTARFQEHGICDRSFHSLLEFLRYIPEELREDVVFEVPAGEKIYRHYEALRDLKASAVMLGEVAMIANSNGYDFHILIPREMQAAQIEVEGLHSYAEYRKQKMHYQMAGYQNFQTIDKSTLSEKERKAVEKRVKTLIVRQTPLGVFTIRPEEMSSSQEEKAHICLMHHPMRKGLMRLFRNKKSLELDAPIYFNPNMQPDEIDVEEFFM